MYKLEVLKEPYLSSDLEEILAINQANIPEVGSVPDMGRLKLLLDWSSHLIVIRKDEIAGFIILMREGQNYDSLNYDFFNSKDYPCLLYTSDAADD